MIRLFIDPRLQKEYPVLCDMFLKSRFKNRFHYYTKQRIRKKDIIVLTYSGSEIENADQLFNYALCFQNDGFNFSEAIHFEKQLDLPTDFHLNELEDLLSCLLKEDFEVLTKKLKRKHSKAYSSLDLKEKDDFKLSQYYKRKINQYEDEWLHCRSKQDFYVKLNQSLNSFIPKKLKMLRVEEVQENDLKELSFLDFGSSECFFAFDLGELTKQECSLIQYFHSIVVGYYQNILLFFNNRNEQEKLTEAFQNLKAPIVVCDKNGSIIIYNKSFLALNLTATDLKKMGNGQVFKHHNCIYHVQQTDSNDIATYHFKVDKNIGNHNSDQDLGIISSSIAHELNNPLAAILAALEVLKLEIDDDDQSSSSILDEMYQGAKRCQGLVETFLGFSRGRQKTSMEEFSEIFKRAYELVRFREIENNIKFQFNIEDSFKEQRFQSSTMVMVIYLILNNILSSYQRHALVTQEVMNVIQINLTKRNTSLNFSCSPAINFNADLFKSKLLDFLLKEENFQLELAASEIKFIQI